jgi:carbonic anhydrase/acetyltransferase-like protein (isoleucine patch superfamily)
VIYAIDDKEPRFGRSGWIAPSATVIGDVVLGEDVSVWWGAVLRGDNDRIEIGNGSNVQDNAVLHTDPGHPISIGTDVTVGHMVMLHGCTIGDGSLIGIGSVILNDVRIGRNCLIGANSFLPEGKEIPDGSVVFGAPGRVVKSVTAEHLAQMRQATESYKERWRHYRSGLRPVAAPPDFAGGR